tara:strand:+ start:835 stop:1371 length:537 start_codon:yes stop_codon:yes gene_type:complete
MTETKNLQNIEVIPPKHTQTSEHLMEISPKAHIGKRAEALALQCVLDKGFDAAMCQIGSIDIVGIYDFRLSSFQVKGTATYTKDKRKINGYQKSFQFNLVSRNYNYTGAGKTMHYHQHAFDYYVFVALPIKTCIFMRKQDVVAKHKMSFTSEFFKTYANELVSKEQINEYGSKGRIYK